MRAESVKRMLCGRGWEWSWMDVNVLHCDEESDNICVSLLLLAELQIGRWNMKLSEVLASKPGSIKPDFMWGKRHSWKKKVMNSRWTNPARLHSFLGPSCIISNAGSILGCQSVGQTFKPDWCFWKTITCHEICVGNLDFLHNVSNLTFIIP